jgi:hypothetical protein
MATFKKKRSMSFRNKNTRRNVRTFRIKRQGKRVYKGRGGRHMRN